MFFCYDSIHYMPNVSLSIHKCIPIFTQGYAIVSEHTARLRLLRNHLSIAAIELYSAMGGARREMTLTPLHGL